MNSKISSAEAVQRLGTSPSCLRACSEPAKRESGYKESVDRIQALARVRGIIEAYHPQLAIVETIEALRAQSAEREAATALLRNTVDSVKTRIREQADFCWWKRRPSPSISFPFQNFSPLHISSDEIRR